MRYALILTALLWATPSYAQQEVDASRLYLGETGTVCRMQVGTGSPEASVTAPVCSQYINSSTGLWYYKSSGTGNTGWVITIAGFGGAGTFLRSTGSAWAASTLILPNSATAGDTVVATSANTWGAVAAAAAGKIFQATGVGTVPAWTTATYPATATSGTIIRASAANVWSISQTTYPDIVGAGNVLYGTASNTVGSLAIGATEGMFIRRNASSMPDWSTLILPNAATANRVVFASSTNTYGEDADLTFLTDTLTATKIVGSTSITNSALTATRVVFSGTAGLQADDADLTFATDTLTATKVIAPTSLTTPLVYGYGATKTLSLGGSGVGGCPTSAPTTANCEAGILTFTSAMFEQQLATDATYRTQWFVNTDGGMVRAYTTNAYIPMNIEGAPVRLRGGGVHIGGTAGVSDPGVGNTYVDGWFRSTNPTYASQTTGMAVDFANSSIDTQYLFANEMHVKNFIADLEQALAGSQIISKSVAVLASDFTVPAGGSISTLTLKDLPSAANMAVFESGDSVRLRQFSRASGSLSVTDAYGVVTSYADGATAGTQTWTFTRSLSPCSGAATTGTVISADALVLDYGVSGNGFIESNAIDGVYGINSPYTQAVTWATCISTQTVRTRTGNLRGIGPGTWGYGLFAGDYSNGKYAVFSDQTVELHGVPFTLYNSTTPVIALSPTTPSFAMGTDTTSMTATAGVGSWSGLSGGCFLWRLGDPAAQNINFNSCTGILALTGAITVSGTLPDANNALALVGTAGATVVSGAALATTGLTAAGNPSLPATVSTTTSKLYLGSDFMGYWNSTCSCWKTFIQSNGNFYLGGTGGNLTWVEATSSLAITGSITITGGSGYANLSDKPALGTMSALNTITMGTDTTGGYAGSASEGGSAADTVLVNAVAAATVSGGAIRANTGLDASGNVARFVAGANLAAGTAITGLNLTSSYLGFYDGAAWKTFMDSSGNFYLGGTSGPLTWVAGSSAGTIAGWAFNATTLTKVSGANTITLEPAGAYVILAGPTGAPTFTVTPAGVLSATGATISGAITATSGSFTGTVSASAGTIGGLTLSASALYTGSKTAYNDANAGVHFGTDGIGFGNNVFTVSAAGALVATNATVSNAGGVVTIGSGGLSIAVPPSSLSNSYAYRFVTDWTGTNWFGVFGYNPDASHRWVTMDNISGESGKVPGVAMQAVSSTGGTASITLLADTSPRITVVSNNFAVNTNGLFIVGGLSSDGRTIRGGTITPTSLTGSVNNWTPTSYSTSTFWRISSNAAYDITGIGALVDGTEITLWNGGSFTITLKNDTTSTAANRFLTPGGADFPLSQYKAVTIRYDATSVRWIVIG